MLHIRIFQILPRLILLEYDKPGFLDYPISLEITGAALSKPAAAMKRAWKKALIILALLNESEIDEHSGEGEYLCQINI